MSVESKIPVEIDQLRASPANKIALPKLLHILERRGKVKAFENSFKCHTEL